VAPTSPDDAHPTYGMSLILSHPRRSPDEVSTALQMDPDRCWDRGSAQNTADGRALPGRHEENFWSKELPSLMADELSLPRAIEGLLATLEGGKAYLNAYAVDGQVSLEIYGDWMDTTRVTLRPELLGRLADYGVSLVFW
jgi:hypothetical protein